MPILAELPSGLQLTDLHLTVLGSTGVRTADDLHGLLSAFPSLASKFGIPSSRITSALAPRLSAAYAAATVMAQPPPPAMGAIAPIGETYTVALASESPARRSRCHWVERPKPRQDEWADLRPA
jgi:hypothetical protein